MSLGEKIKNLRESLGLNQSELARLIGKKPHYINQIEKGTFRPSLRTLDKIAQMLNTRSCILLDETAPPVHADPVDPQYKEYVNKLIVILREKNLNARIVKNVLDIGFEAVRAKKSIKRVRKNMHGNKKDKIKH